MGETYFIGIYGRCICNARDIFINLIKVRAFAHALYFPETVGLVKLCGYISKIEAVAPKEGIKYIRDINLILHVTRKNDQALRLN